MQLVITKVRFSPATAMSPPIPPPAPPPFEAASAKTCKPHPALPLAPASGPLSGADRRLLRELAVALAVKLALLAALGGWLASGGTEAGAAPLAPSDSRTPRDNDGH